MSQMSDITLSCRECGKKFVFTEGEQDFYNSKGFISPSRCPECRTEKRNQPQHLVCSQCRSELEKGSSVFCTACLASVQLECELTSKEYINKTEEVQSELDAVASQKTELAELLAVKEQMITELEQKIKSLNHDLDTVRKITVDLSQLQPTIDNIKGKLDSLELAQNKSNQRMLQIVQKMHEMYEGTSLLEVIKRSFRHYPKHSTSQYEA